MISIRETLLQTIEQLSETEIQHVLSYAQTLKERHQKDELSDCIGDIPGVILPEKWGNFPHVTPVKGSGIPASELLIKERR